MGHHVHQLEQERLRDRRDRILAVKADFENVPV